MSGQTESMPSLITFSVGLQRAQPRSGRARQAIVVVIEKLIGRRDLETGRRAGWASESGTAAVRHRGRAEKSTEVWADQESIYCTADVMLTLWGLPLHVDCAVLAVVAIVRGSCHWGVQTCTLGPHFLVSCCCRPTWPVIHIP